MGELNNNGFFMLSRDILKDPMYLSERFTRIQAYSDLCYLAAFKEREFRIRGNKVTLQRGQVAKSVRDLAQRWQWSVNTVTKFIKELQEDGYIETQRTSVNQIITIKRYLMYNTQNETQDDTQIDTQIETQTNTQIDTPIINIEEIKKEIKKELKEELANASKKKSPKTSLDLSVVIPEFSKVVTDWLEYKKERGEEYKPRGFASFYKKILKLSGGDPVKAQKIVEESKANNYAGIFPLKEKKGSGLHVGMILNDDRDEKLKNAEGW
jgi:DNA-binding transcriptional regulator YhcF (GntR family)